MTHYKNLGSAPKPTTKTSDSVVFSTAAILGFICLPLGILYALALLFEEKE